MSDFENLMQWAITEGYEPERDYTPPPPKPKLKPGYFSEHFSHNEFACKCRNYGYGPLCNGWGSHPLNTMPDDFPVIVMDSRLFIVLEEIRDHFGVPFNVNSGFRCSGHNKKQGGATGSKHLKGQAADIWSSEISPEMVYAFCDARYPDCGVGRYPSFTHIDVRGSKARWG